MAINNRSMFRQKALENYQRIQTPKVLPRFVAPITVFWLWIMFFLLIAVVFMLWTLQVPVTGHGTGVMRQLTASELQANKLPENGQSGRVFAELLFPEQAATVLHTGSSVSVVIAGSQSVIGKVEKIGVQLMTADEKRQYGQQSGSASSLSPPQPQPQTITLVSFDAKAVNGVRDGTPATASYQAGTAVILPLLLQTISFGGN